MNEELVFKIQHKNHNVDKYYFPNDKKPININEVDTKKMVLSNKAPHGDKSAIKYYIGYLSGGFRPLCIIIKDIKLYTNHKNILANNK